MFEYDQYRSLAGCSGIGYQQLNALNPWFWDSLFGPDGLGLVRYQGPDEDGWHTYIGDRPPEDTLCVFERHTETYQTPSFPQITRWVGYRNEFHPEFNIANLKWRLTGIAKETQ